MDVVSARRRAATAAIVAAAFILAGHAYTVFVLPGLLGDPGSGGTVSAPPGEVVAWMHLPTALHLLVIAGIPLAAAALLLARHHHRPLLGVAVVAAVGLLVTFSVPGQLLHFTVRAGMASVLMQLFFLGYAFAMVVALFFAIAAIVGGRSLGWVDPRRAERSTLRVVLLAAATATAIGAWAPAVLVEGERMSWLSGMLSGGLDPAILPRQFASVVLPQLGVVAVGLAAAGARPARVGAAVGAVIAADGIVAVVGTPVSNAAMGALWGREYALTPWYWGRVAAVVVLVVSVTLLWRSRSAGTPEPSTVDNRRDVPA